MFISFDSQQLHFQGIYLKDKYRIQGMIYFDIKKVV